MFREYYRPKWIKISLERKINMNDLQFAIKMERDGEKFYREQAELNKGNVLFKVCTMLADDEKKHAKLFENKMNSLPCEILPSAISDTKTIFEGLGDLKIEEKSQLSQLDFYRIAGDLEKESIALYTKYLNNSNDDESKELYKYLIGQEQLHSDTIEALVEALRHAEEWIENARFGVRPEY